MIFNSVATHVDSPVNLRETKVKIKLWNHSAREIIYQLCFQTGYNDVFDFADTIA